MNTRALFASIAGALILAGCTGSGGGATVDRMRQMVGSGQQPAQLAAQPTPPPTQPAAIVPTETPDFSNAQPTLQAQPTAQPVYIEVTRQVTDVQQVEVTRIVEVTTTPQPAAIMAGIDESVQPCPAPFWKRGRCTATAAQLAAYAQQQGDR